MIIQHNDLRDLIQQIGKTLDYESIKEYPIKLNKEKANQIDVVWKKNEKIIAFEIENSDNKELQYHNLIKVLNFKPNIFIPIYYKQPRILKELKGLLGVFPIIINKIGAEYEERKILETIYQVNHNPKLKKKIDKVNEFRRITKKGKTTYYKYKQKLKMLEEAEKDIN